MLYKKKAEAHITICIIWNCLNILMASSARIICCPSISLPQQHTMLYAYQKKQIFVRTGFESAFFRKHFQYWIKQMSKALIILHFPPYNRYCLHLCIKNKCIYFGSKTRFSIIMLRWTVPKSAMHLCNFGIWICISTSWSVYINTVVQYGSLGTRFYPGNIWVDFIHIQKRKKNN